MYHAFYGLSESPFGLTPDPKYLFASEGHKEALAHIAYGIEERRGFVLILGEVGTGKTTLVRHVLRRFGPDVKSVFLFNSSSLGFEELLQAVLRDLEVPSPGRRRVDLIDTLNEVLLQENAAGRRVVLIIDEAQHLSASVLEDIRMLSNLETARSKLLQIVLVGQPELGERLGQVNLRQLRQRIGLAAELKPLNRSDTVQYVHHRLAVAGCRDRIFSRLALRTVYRKSRGIPRLINVICDKSLVLGYGADKKHIGRRIVSQVAGDWAVFHTTGRDATTASSGRASARAPARSSARSRIRRTRRGSHRGRIAAAVSVGILLTGFLVVRSGTWDQTGVARALMASVARLSPEAASKTVRPEPATAAPQPVKAHRDEPASAPPVTAPQEKAAPESQAAAPEQPEGGAPTPGAPPISGPSPLPPAEGPAAAVVTVGTKDTLSWLLYSVYGRADETVVDVVQLANPRLHDVDQLSAGQRLRFPPLEPTTMVHKAPNGRYVVHLLTTSKPTDRQLQKLRADIVSSGRTVRLERVRLGTQREVCYRLWVGDFPTAREAEAFYRRAQPGEAA